MKASEFRIGNYYNQFGNIEKVSWATLKVLEKRTNKQLWCEPIQLTEEWLLKFGFDETEKRTYEISNFKDSVDFCITLEYNSVSLTLLGDDPIYFKYKTMYVHQLQNLVYALTNEELTYEQQK